MEILIISVFVLGYVLITLEHSIKIDKLIPALGNDGYSLGTYCSKSS